MNQKKRQDFPTDHKLTGLYIVATPLGNLGDLSTRAKSVLSGVGAVLCEDTRRTSQLLAGSGIDRQRLERFDEHATQRWIDHCVQRLLDGEVLALVSDAGTPAVSDPGAKLVAAARHAGVVVTPVPGPSAPVTLLSVAGFYETAFTFRGFFPRKKAQKEEEWKIITEASVSGASSVFVWFESPERILETLNFCSEKNAELNVCVGKELTKLHERYFWGKLSAVTEEVKAEIASEGARGEWSFAICMRNETAAEGQEVHAEDESTVQPPWEKALICVLKASESPSRATQIICQEFGVPKKAVYARALVLSGKKEQ